MIHMLRGSKAYLRARMASDVPVLQEHLYEDIATRVRADTRPWRPMTRDAASSPYAVADPTDETAVFSVVDIATGELAGEALLWGIDLHNRNAHLGLALLPRFRGQGVSIDVLAVLSGYAFNVLGLNRLQIETDAENTAMLRAADRAGFIHEGIRRNANWADGAFRDEAILGLLAGEWVM
jgi:RimJ/RimL family protein N-acetyltransferase